jgi:superfamily II DNA or RNA helicase
VNLHKLMPPGTKYVHRNSSKKEVGSYALTPKAQRQTIADFINNEFQFLIATDAFRAGVDVPNCSVVVQAAGGASEIETIQEAVRGSRTLSEADQKRLGVGPKTHFNLIDIWDGHDTTLENMSKKREKFYREQGWIIRKVKDPKDIDWNYYPTSSEL